MGTPPGKDRGSPSLLEQEPGRPNSTCRAALPTIKQKTQLGETPGNRYGPAPAVQSARPDCGKMGGMYRYKARSPNGRACLYLLRCALQCPNGQSSPNQRCGDTASGSQSWTRKAGESRELPDRRWIRTCGEFLTPKGILAGRFMRAIRMRRFWRLWW